MHRLLHRKPKTRPLTMPPSHVRLIQRDAPPFDQDALIGWYRSNFPYQTARIEAEAHQEKA
jgi:hypothetical protein